MKHEKFLLFFVFLILLKGQINAQIEINQQKEKPVFIQNQDSTPDYQNVVIITYPDDAFLTVNKKYLGTTPLEARLRLGINHFYITKPGYQIFENKYIISKNSGRFEIHLTQESSLSVDSVIIKTESPSIDRTPDSPNYQVTNYDKPKGIQVSSHLSEFEKAGKIKKVSYLVSLGCFTGAIITGSIANKKYNKYKNASENVNQLHDQIVVLDNIRNGLITVGVSFIIIGIVNEMKCHRLKKYNNTLSGCFFFLPESDALFATIRLDI